jgi:ferredoxin
VTRRLRVAVDRAVCIGSGMCVGSSPDMFELDAFRQSHPRCETVEDTQAVWDAAENCPVEAISVHDADTGEELFPGE